MPPRLRAGIHARRSLNRGEEQSASVRRQLSDGRQLAARIGADVVKTWEEDDTSAFKKRLVTLPDGRRVRRNVRPEWQEAIRWLYEGTIDVLIEYDLDRAMREPRDLEDLIEIVETTGREVHSVTGSLSLRNDHEITMARVMVAMANKSSRDTSRRVQSAALDRAVAGLNHGGRRCFGYAPTGLTLMLDEDGRPTESIEVAWMADQLLKGVPLGSIVRQLNARGARTVTGGPWTPNVVRELLRNPRLAGLSPYKGKAVGKGQWPAIISEEQHLAIAALISDPSRRTSTGNRAAYLLSGLAKCGVCGHSITSGGRKKTVSANGDVSYRHMYRCRPTGCVGRRTDWVDDIVIRYTLERLSRPDAVALLVDERTPDFDRLKDEAESIRIRMDEAAAAFADGAINAAQMRTATARLQERLDAIEAQRGDGSRAPILRDLIEAADPRAVWESKTLDQQRAIVSCLWDIKLHPGGGGMRTPQPEYIEVTPKG